MNLNVHETRSMQDRPMTGILDRIDGIGVSERDGGVVIDIATRSCHAAIALQGAQVLHWHPAGQSHDVLWLSPVARFGGGKAIRGGVPICWPWFGQHPLAEKPQHGFARNAMWSVIEARRTGDDVTLVFELPANCLGREHLEGTARLRFHVTVGAALDMSLETMNTGAAPITITQALHTYLRVGDVSRISVEGLDGATYRDNTDGGRAKEQHGTMTIPRETVAIFDEAATSHVLIDPVLGRRIAVTRSGGRSTVVWNPGASAAGMGDVPPPSQNEFVCIESGAVGAAAMTLAPGSVARIGQQLKLDAG
jgi:glucose-6-phosphate 1-epimerase